MKRVLTILLCAALLALLCACGSSGAREEGGPSPSPTPTPSPYAKIDLPAEISLGMEKKEVRGILPDGAETSDDKVELKNAGAKGWDLDLPNDYSVDTTRFHFDGDTLVSVDYRLTHSGDTKEVDGEPVVRHEFDKISGYLTERYGGPLPAEKEKPKTLRAAWQADGMYILLGASTLTEDGDIALRYADNEEDAEDGFWLAYFGSAAVDGLKDGAEKVLEALLDGAEDDGY